jgi:hypothetical protein
MNGKAATLGGLSPRKYDVDELPINYRQIDCSKIKEEADYAVRQMADIDAFASRHGFEWADAGYLELGPGHNYAQALLLADRGAACTVLDQFAPCWQEYHELLYREILARVSSKSIRACLDAGRHVAVRCVEEPAKDMRSIPNSSHDFLYSCAVFEHACTAENLDTVARELARVSRPGALHLHYIDLRNHGDLVSNPFGHLLWSDAQFSGMNRNRHNEYGTRLRSSEFHAAFEAAGLEVLDFTPTIVQKIPLDTLLQVRGVAGSSYCQWPVEDLETLSIRFELRRADSDRCPLLENRAAVLSAFHRQIRSLSFRKPKPGDHWKAFFFSQDGGASPAQDAWRGFKERLAAIPKNLFWKLSDSFWRVIRYVKKG